MTATSDKTPAVEKAAGTVATKKPLTAIEVGAKHIGHWDADFAAVLPSHMDRATFARLAVGVLRKNPDVADAAAQNPASLWHALMECSRLGHEPGTNQFALTVFKVKIKDTDQYRPEVVGMEQYQGKIERMYRASIPGEFGVQAIHADVVRENDLYVSAAESGTGRPIHKRGWFTTDPPGQARHGVFVDEGARGQLVGAYAYAELAGGAVSRVVEMPKSEVMKHKAAAKTPKFWNGTWEESMWIKTAVHQLETWVPTSAEYRRQAAATSGDVHGAPRSAAAESGNDQPEGDVVEGTVVA